MRRRALLATLGSLSAGCLGAAPPSGPPSAGTDAPAATPPPTAATPTATPPGDAEYRLTDLAVSTGTERPTARYVLETSAFYSAAAVQREEERTGEERVVRDVSELEDGPVRDAIETALRDGEWRADELPAGLAETVESVDFFTGIPADGTYTHIGLSLHRLHPDRPPALEFDAAVVDGWVAPDSPGAVELSVTNVGEERQELFSGTVPPFGLVVAEALEGGDGFLLWREYEAEGCVSFQDEGWVVCAIGIITEIDPGETISRRYEVLPSTTSAQPAHTVPPGPDRYQLTGQLSYDRGGGAPSSELGFDVRFTLEPQG